jgi:hypothetical protein
MNLAIAAPSPDDEAWQCAYRGQVFRIGDKSVDAFPANDHRGGSGARQDHDQH